MMDRDALRAYQRDWRRQRRLTWLEGKSCEWCGYDDPDRLRLTDRELRNLRDRCDGNNPWVFSQERFEREVVPHVLLLCERCLKKREWVWRHGDGGLNLTVKQVDMLWYVADNGGTTLIDLGRDLRQPHASMYDRVRALERRGYVERERRREGLCVWLTERGYERLVEIAGANVAAGRLARSAPSRGSPSGGQRRADRARQWWEWYMAEPGRTLGDVAARAGCTRAWVGRELERYGLARKGMGTVPRAQLLDAATGESLGALWEEEYRRGSNPSRIARKFSVAPNTVITHLVQAGAYERTPRFGTGHATPKLDTAVSVGR